MGVKWVLSIYLVFLSGRFRRGVYSFQEYLDFEPVVWTQPHKPFVTSLYMSALLLLLLTDSVSKLYWHRYCLSYKNQLFFLPFWERYASPSGFLPFIHIVIFFLKMDGSLDNQTIQSRKYNLSPYDLDTFDHIFHIV